MPAGNIAKWNTPRALATILSTELNALGSATLSAASASLDNSVNLDMFADIELNLASLSPGVNPYCTLYILEAVDGTNFPSASATPLRNQPSAILCTFPLDSTAATAQRITIRNVPLPPAIFKVALDNQSGTPLNASGNTVKILAYNTNLAGQ